jgi:hypothetical protein
MTYDLKVPQPIGEKFCHRHFNGAIEHHESEWQMTGLEYFSECPECGVVALAVNQTVSQFYRETENAL